MENKMNTSTVVSTSNTVADIVDRVALAYEAKKSATEAFAAAEQELIRVATPLYETCARGLESQFKKTYEFQGNKTPGVKVTWRNAFKVIPLDLMPTIKASLGRKFGEFFQVKKEVTLLDSSEDTINFLKEKLGKKDFDRLFKTSECIAVKGDMDRLQFGLPDDVRKLMKQNEPAVSLIKK